MALIAARRRCRGNATVFHVGIPVLQVTVSPRYGILHHAIPRPHSGELYCFWIEMKRARIMKYYKRTMSSLAIGIELKPQGLKDGGFKRRSGRVDEKENGGS